MTRSAIAVTTFGQRITCDRCGLTLYTSRPAGVGKRGWVVVEGKDYCPGCKESVKVGIDYESKK